MKSTKDQINQSADTDRKPTVMCSLLIKYQEEWKKAKANSKRTTKGGYEKVYLKEWGKMEAFAMIMDDLAHLQ